MGKVLYYSINICAQYLINANQFYLNRYRFSPFNLVFHVNSYGQSLKFKDSSIFQRPWEPWVIYELGMVHVHTFLTVFGLSELGVVHTFFDAFLARVAFLTGVAGFLFDAFLARVVAFLTGVAFFSGVFFLEPPGVLG